MLNFNLLLISDCFVWLSMFKCGLSAACDVNSSLSWSGPDAHSYINDNMHRTVFTEANMAAAIQVRSSVENRMCRQLTIL